MLRYRITTTTPTDGEQTWALLPDQPSAVTQAEELARREPALHVRVYREEVPGDQELDLDLPPRAGR